MEYHDILKTYSHLQNKTGRCKLCTMVDISFTVRDDDVMFRFRLVVVFILFMVGYGRVRCGYTVSTMVLVHIR